MDKAITNAEIVETLATKVMGWKSGPVYGPDSEVVGLWFADGIDSPHTRYYVPYTDKNRFDPLTSVSDAFMVLEAGEWDYIVRRSRSDGRYFVHIVVNSVWGANHLGVPRRDDLNLYGFGNADTLCRAICDALVAAIAAIGEKK